MTAGSWHSLPDREMPTFGHFDTTSIEDDEVRSALERIKQELEQLNRGCAKPLYGMRAHCWMPDVTPVRYGYYMASFNEMVLSVPLTDNEVTTRKIMLPDAATRPGGYVEVVDYAGDSATTNITVATIKGQTINGATTFTINENYSAIQFRSDGACWRVVGKGGGATVITDHGGLSGLADDDHSQYHNDARGDARYLQKSNNLSDLASDDTAISNLVAGATSRTPIELHEVVLSDINAAGTSHGRATVAGLRTAVVTADTGTALALGIDSTKGPWKMEVVKNLTSSGGGAQTLHDVPIPTDSATTVYVELNAVRASDGAKPFGFIGGVVCGNDGGTLTLGTPFTINSDDIDGLGYAVTFSVSTTNVRITFNDGTATARVGAIITRTHRNSTA